MPSSIDLAAAELELSARIGRENTLRKKLAPVRDRYDYVLIDTPPSLGLLTLNALVACDEVIIPIQTHYYALLGMRQLLRTIKVVREEVGHEIEIAGVVPTMYDARTSISKEILEGIKDYFGDGCSTARFTRISSSSSPAWSACRCSSTTPPRAGPRST